MATNVPPSSPSSNPHRCKKCGSCFLLKELLYRHERYWCNNEAPLEGAPSPSFPIPRTAGGIPVHFKRLKVSQTAYLPIAPRLKGTSLELVGEVSKRKLPRSLPPSPGLGPVIEKRDDGASSLETTSPNSKDSQRPRVSHSDSVPNTTSSTCSNTLKPQSLTASLTQQGKDSDPDSLALQATRDKDTPLPPLSSCPISTLEAALDTTSDRPLQAQPLRDSRPPKPLYLEGPANDFGLRRRCYASTHDTKEYAKQLKFCDLYNPVDKPSPPRRLTNPTPSKQLTSPFGPFPNLSSFQLGEWYLEAGSQLSVASLRQLVKLAQAPGFSESISEANWVKIFDKLGRNREELAYREDGSDGDSEDGSDNDLEDLEDADGRKPTTNKDEDDWADDDGWKSTPITIKVPLGKATALRTVGTLYHRSITSIVQQKILNCPDHRLFHYDPFEVIWQPDGSLSPQRVHSELYTSDAFVQAHRELQDSPPIPGCTRPRVVVGLMFWSDETHLTAFSHEKLWPLYMLFGNESKQRRCQPTADCCHHIAYFDKVSGEFKDFVTDKTGGRVPSKEFMTYCKGEMFHEQWHIILDDELLEAIKHGLVIKCQDGIERRFFIRIFTYSADYPEKVLIATTRQNGDHPCPRCLVAKEDIHKLGTPEDINTRSAVREDDGARQVLVKAARRRIFEDKVVVNNKHIKASLKPQSLHPIMSAFSRRLSTSGFNIFTALVVDLLHEFEIGVWKSLFIHLLRIIHAGQRGGHLIHKLDKRYRLVPTFGKGIRRFSANVSEMKKKAARDYEDLLQCAIPTFESIVPNESHSIAIMSLLSVCARWHALAKLRMHTDATLSLLDDTTAKLGHEFREFVENVCSQVQTKELDSEVLMRERREQQKIEKEKKKADLAAQNVAKAKQGRKKKSVPTNPPDTENELGPKLTPTTQIRTGQNQEVQVVSESSQAVNTEGQPPCIVETKSCPGRARKDTNAPSASGTGEPCPEGQTKRRSARLSKNLASRTLAPPALSEATTKSVAKRGPGRPRKNPIKDSGASVSALQAPSVPLQAMKLSTSETSLLASTKVQTVLPSGGGNGPSAHGIAAVEGPGSAKSIGSTDASQKQEKLAMATRKPTSSRKRVALNINIPKFHFLGDYSRTIRMFGTTDSYSTEMGELMHRFPKRWYRRSSKKNARKDVVKYERKLARIKKLRKALNAKKRGTTQSPVAEQEIPDDIPDIHHFIGPNQNAPISLSSFASQAPLSETSQETSDTRDPVGKAFISNLQEYLLPRILSHIREILKKDAQKEGAQMPAMFTQRSAFDPAYVCLKDHRIFSHKVMRLNYTTYDVRRGGDLLHVGADVCNVMIPNPRYTFGSTAPPYLYARLLGIFHGHVSYAGEIAPGIRHHAGSYMEFLLVRPYKSSPADDMIPLERVSFSPITSPNSTAFIDPDSILRAAHIIPRFHLGKVHAKGEGLSEMGRDGDDWNEYYVNRYADRDMFMRYEIGMAIGHQDIFSRAGLRETWPMTPLDLPQGPWWENLPPEPWWGDREPLDNTPSIRTENFAEFPEGVDEDGDAEEAGCLSDASEDSCDDMRMDVDGENDDWENDLDEGMDV